MSGQGESGRTPVGNLRRRTLAFVLLACAGAQAAVAQEPPRTWSDGSAAAEDGYRYEAIQRPARFKSSESKNEVMYEERVVTYTEQQTVYRTVQEDQGCWMPQRRWTLLGPRTEYIWCPNIVEKQVPELVTVTRQRTERIPKEMTVEVRKTVAEPVVVQVRRPNKPKSYTSIEERLLTRRGRFEPARSAATEDSSFGGN